jgi:hypothetical protein
MAVRPGRTNGALSLHVRVMRLPVRVSSVASSGSMATSISVSRSRSMMRRISEPW